MPHKNEIGKLHHRHDKLGFGKSHHVRDSAGGHDAGCPCGAGITGQGGNEQAESTVAKKKRADLTPYRIDQFDGGVTYEESTSWGAGVSAASGEEHDDEAWVYTTAGSVVRSTPDRYTFSLSGCSGSSNYAQGFWHQERWHEVTVPTYPTTEWAGVYVSVPQGSNYDGYLNTHSGIVPQTYGFQLRVSSTQPASMRDGTLVTTFFSTLNDNQETFFVPKSLIPSAGSTLYYGIVPNWDTIEGMAGGPCWGGGIAGQNYDVASALMGQLESISTGASSPSWGVIASATGETGAVESDDAWFEGNLAWNDPTGETNGAFGWDVDEGTRTFTNDAATNGSGSIQMDGAGAEDDDESAVEGLPQGEPWDVEDGCRMLVRFKISEVGSLIDAGTRGLTMEIGTTQGPYSITAHFGDTTDAAGVEIAFEDQTAVLDKTIAADTYYWMWIDTRNEDRVRGKLFEDLHPALPLLFAGEPPDPDVEISIDNLTEVSGEAEDSYLKLTINSGNASGTQVVHVSHIYVIGPGHHGELIEEYIGSGDDSATTYYASMPVAQGSLEATAWGQHIDIDVTDREFGTFTTTDGQAVPDYGRIKVRYEVDREQIYDDDVEYEEDEV